MPLFHRMKQGFSRFMMVERSHFGTYDSTWFDCSYRHPQVCPLIEKGLEA
jgi:hypothetical protein